MHKATPAKLPPWFVPYTRWRMIGLRYPATLKKYPRPPFPAHITKEVQWVLDEWHRYLEWEAWILSGRHGPRPADLWKNATGQPISPGWAGDTLRLVRANMPPKPPLPPPPPPGPPPIPGIERYQNVVVGAQNVMDALAWPGCKIWFTADPNPPYSDQPTRENAKRCRDAGHQLGVWYVPDQVSHDRALTVADILGTDPDQIACDVETLHRWRLSVEHGVHIGIANLSALFEDDEAHKAIAEHRYIVMNEFYWNQDRSRQPDNHDLPVTSMQVAVYPPSSDDSDSPNRWDPSIADYKAAGYYWQTMGCYSVDMTAADWANMPRIA